MMSFSSKDERYSPNLLNDDDILIVNNNNDYYSKNRGYINESGDMENQAYQLMFDEQRLSTTQSINLMDNFENNTNGGNSSYLGYLKCAQNQVIGPIVLNVCNKKNSTVPLYNMEFSFLNENSVVQENLNKIKILKEFQDKLDKSIKASIIAPYSSVDNLPENIRRLLSLETLQFQVTKLPFEHLSIGSTSSIKSTSNSYSQTPSISEDAEKLLQFMRQEIDLLKEQNGILKTQLEAKQIEKQKEYVLRKSSISTNKSISASTNVPNNSNSRADNENIYEILQEYMLENEDLRKQNNQLCEMKHRQSSDINVITNQNKALAERIQTLTHMLRTLESQNPKVPKQSKENPSNYSNQEYPIMATETSPNRTPNPKHSYLKNFDSLKSKQTNNNPNLFTNSTNNKTPSTAPKQQLSISTQNSFTKATQYNETLREELDRIENTIRDHIRKSQLHDTIRGMGSKNSNVRKQ